MQKSYDDVNAMWQDLLDELFTYGRPTPAAREGTAPMSHEIVGWSGRLLNPRRNFLTNVERAASPAYAAAELLWYLSRDDSVEMLLPYAPSYKRFAEPNGRAHGAYGKRIATNVTYGDRNKYPGNWGYTDQLDYALQRLKRDSNTRQLVITMWRPDDLVTEDKKDVPCTVCWQFRLRDNNLHMVSYMRSNDAWLGFPYDVFAFTSIQQLLAASLGAGVGEYVHDVGSMHLYETDLERAHIAVRESLVSAEYGDHGWLSTSKLEDSAWAVELERQVRLRRDAAHKAPLLSSSLLSDCVRCCARELNASCLLPVSPIFCKGFENVHSRRTRLGR